MHETESEARGSLPTSPLERSRPSRAWIAVLAATLLSGCGAPPAISVVGESHAGAGQRRRRRPSAAGATSSDYRKEKACQRSIRRRRRCGSIRPRPTRGTIETNKGAIEVEFFPDDAPQTVNNFVCLAEDGYYDGTPFHRIVNGFVIQGGDPTGTGTGGPGYQFNDEPVAQGLRARNAGDGQRRTEHERQPVLHRARRPARQAAEELHDLRPGDRRHGRRRRHRRTRRRVPAAAAKTRRRPSRSPSRRSRSPSRDVGSGNDRTRDNAEGRASQCRPAPRTSNAQAARSQFAANVLVFAQQPNPERLPLGDVGTGQRRLIDPLIAVFESPLERLAPSRLRSLQLERCYETARRTQSRS